MCAVELKFWFLNAVPSCAYSSKLAPHSPELPTDTGHNRQQWREQRAGLLGGISHALLISMCWSCQVAEYQGHWWRCDGPCRDRPPYFGYVKRVMNRPPQPHDHWWVEHQVTCGGTFSKIKEPDDHGGRKKPNGKGIGGTGDSGAKRKRPSPGARDKGKGVSIDELWSGKGRSLVEKPSGTLQAETSRASEQTSIDVAELDREKLTGGAVLDRQASRGGHNREEGAALSGSVGGGSLRDKILAAAEKRQELNKARGTAGSNGNSASRTKMVPASHVGKQESRLVDVSSEAGQLHKSEPVTVLDIGDESPVVKRPRLTPSSKAVTMLDLTSPTSGGPEISQDPPSRPTKSAPRQESSHPPSGPLKSSDLPQPGSGHDGRVDLTSSSGHARSPHPLPSDFNIDDVIFDYDDVTIIDPEADAWFTKSGDQLSRSPGCRTCPVCGRSDIPMAIINSHVTLCLEEEEEFAAVLE